MLRLEHTSGSHCPWVLDGYSLGSDHCQGQMDSSSHGYAQACLPAYIN